MKVSATLHSRSLSPESACRTTAADPTGSTVMLLMSMAARNSCSRGAMAGWLSSCKAAERAGQEHGQERVHPAALAAWLVLPPLLPPHRLLAVCGVVAGEQDDGSVRQGRQGQRQGE